MACDEQLVARIRQLLKQKRGVDERRMFGGVCFMHNGNMTCGVAGTDLMVRVGPDQYEHALAQPHVREMDFTGRAMKGYIFVSAKVTAKEAGLRQWVEAGMTYAGTLPAKNAKA